VAQAGLGKRGIEAPAARRRQTTVGRTMTESAARVLTEITTLAGSAHESQAYWTDAPLIRVSTSGQQDPVIAAIARHIGDTGSVFLELPDGRLTVVLYLDAGCSGTPKRNVHRTSRASLQHLSDM
jgi:hypothetical protein